MIETCGTYETLIDDKHAIFRISVFKSKAA